MSGLRRSATTQALIDLEDAAPAVLSERMPGSPVTLWSQVRMEFTTLLSETELGDATIPARVSTADVLARFARSQLPSRWDVAGWRAPRELVFLVGGTTLHVRDGRARNWLVDGYARAIPGEAVIVQRAALPSTLGLPFFAPTRSLDPVLARAEVKVALRRGRPAPTDARVRELIQEFARLLGLDGDPRLTGVADSAAWNERIRPSVVRAFTDFLDRTRPRALVVEDASYGGYFASLIAVARSRGIVVAEPQHGWLGPAHAAYNYGASMHRPEQSVAIPDVLLTFGEQWGEGLSFPGDVVAIGKPHLEERAARAPDVAERPRDALVVSSISRAAETLGFLRELRAELPDDWTVRFRPHPGERAVLDTRYPGLREMPGVVVDDRADVLDSLAACRIVVGVASTVLFEAAAFGCRVFVRDSPYVPIVVGDLFGPPLADAGGVARIAAVAADPAATDDGRPSVDVERLWRPDAVDNFVRWFGTASGN